MHKTSRPYAPGKKAMRLALVPILALFAAGCATISFDPAIDAIGTSQQFVPVPANALGPANQELARIYFINGKAPVFMGRPTRASMTVFDEGIMIGEAGNLSYLCWERSPGLVSVRFSSPGYEFLPGFSDNMCSYRIHARAGQSYYLYAGPKKILGFQRKVLTEKEAGVFLTSCGKPSEVQGSQGSPFSAGSSMTSEKAVGIPEKPV